MTEAHIVRISIYVDIKLQNGQKVQAQTKIDGEVDRSIGRGGTVKVLGEGEDERANKHQCSSIQCSFSGVLGMSNTAGDNRASSASLGGAMKT